MVHIQKIKDCCAAASNFALASAELRRLVRGLDSGFDGALKSLARVYGKHAAGAIRLTLPTGKLSSRKWWFANPSGLSRPAPRFNNL